VPVVLATMYLTSLIVMALFVGARGDGPPPTDSILAGLCAGVFGIAALTCFYRALAIGTMSIVAPVASTGVSLPVLAGLATGDQPGAARSLGLAAAVVGVVLASREAPSDASVTERGRRTSDDADGTADPRLQRRSVVLAIVAGLGFGMYFVLAEISSNGDVGWALLLSRMAATPFIVSFAILALRRGGRRPRARELVALAAIGMLDLGANVLYNTSTTIGELSTVAVASSLYPVTTVLLAAALLGERVRGIQRVGVLVALLGVVMIAAGA
jgi:drug/metabolite transporter (DMT)-like permease